MKNWFNRYYRTIIISTFLVPIITVAVVSISHVTKWYGISNPLIWAAYLSIGIEIAALSALAAISANMGKKVYFPFGIVTLIQFIGNIYYTYYFIDIDSKSFTSWVELVSPLIEIIGVEPTDLVGHRRFLSVFSGGILPLISLSFLHMLVKFTEEDRIEYDKSSNPNLINSDELISEISRVRLTKDDLSDIENFLLKKNQTKKNKNTTNRKGKINTPKTRSKKSLKEISEVTPTPTDELELIQLVGEVEINNDIIEEEVKNITTDQDIIQEEEIFETSQEENNFLEESEFKETEESILEDEEINDIEDSESKIESEEKKKNLI